MQPNTLGIRLHGAAYRAGQESREVTLNPWTASRSEHQQQQSRYGVGCRQYGLQR